MSSSCSEILDTGLPREAEEDVIQPHVVASVLGLVLCALFVWMFANTLRHRERIGSTDFLQEWTSVRNWLTDRPIYAPLHTTLPVYFGPQARSVVDLNAHPPTAVILAIPFGLLPYQEAWLWWNVANLASIGLSLWLLLGRRGLRFGLGGCTLVVLGVLSSNALKEQVQLGQLNGWLLLLLTMAWRADRRGQPWISGACIGVAAAIKLFPGFILLYFLACRNWKACFAAAASFVTLTLATVSAVGWHAYADYARLVLPSLGQFRTAWLNASLHGFWSKVLVGRADRMAPLVEAPLLAQAAIVLTCLAVAGGVGWLAFRARSRRHLDFAYATTIIAMLLVCPITWDHYFLLLVPAIAILWRAQQNSSVVRILHGGLALILLTVRPGWVFALFIPGPGEFAEFMGQQPPLVQPGQTLTALSYQFYALVALFGLATCAARAVLCQRERLSTHTTSS